MTFGSIEDLTERMSERGATLWIIIWAFTGVAALVYLAAVFREVMFMTVHVGVVVLSAERVVTLIAVLRRIEDRDRRDPETGPEDRTPPWR